MLTTAETAKILGVSTASIRVWLNEEGHPRFPNAQKFGRDWQIPESDLKGLPRGRRPGRPPKAAETFRERLTAIAAEILEELSDQYAEFVIHPQAQDSNDWNLTYIAHSGDEKPVRVIRRAGQTDDEVKDEIRAQLLPKTDGDGRASKRTASKKSAKKGAK